METKATKTYHRLSLQTYENADGPEGWRIVDRQHQKVIMRGPGETIEVIRRFLGNERMEALLCSEIDVEFSPVIDHE
jgi:hypothetical protein